jgi:hypothetical protein
MAARFDHGRAQLLTRTGLDWTDKYPSVIAALANVKAKTAYLDGELCGVDEAGLPSFANTQAATDAQRGVRLVYYAFDLLHLDGRDVSGLPLVKRKALLERLTADKLGLQFNGHETGDGELILKHAGKLVSRASSPRRSTLLMRRRRCSWATIQMTASSSTPAALGPGCLSKFLPICGAALSRWPARRRL